MWNFMPSANNGILAPFSATSPLHFVASGFLVSQDTEKDGGNVAWRRAGGRPSSEQSHTGGKNGFLPVRPELLQ